MIPSLEGLPTKAKETPSPHEVRLAPLDTNPVFHSLGEKPKGLKKFTRKNKRYAVSLPMLCIRPSLSIMNHEA